MVLVDQNLFCRRFTLGTTQVRNPILKIPGLWRFSSQRKRLLLKKALSLQKSLGLLGSVSGVTTSRVGLATFAHAMGAADVVIVVNWPEDQATCV